MNGARTAPVIAARDLVKRYGEVLAVNGLSFEVAPGETFALIGPNGAGKTTTLKLLLGLARPDRGTIVIGAERRPPTDPRARHQLGYVPQKVEFPPERTVEEVLAFYAELRGLPASAVQRALARANLAAHARRRASELSGGITQRLSLAQAMLGDPGLLVLDEPTASLDPEATWEFRSLVEQLRDEGVTILLCSHLLAEVERVADRVLILVEGRAAAMERIDVLRDHQARAARLAVEVGAGAANAAKAAEVLARIGLRVERADGRQLVVEARNGHVPRALEALRAGGVELRGFEVLRPSLEEIFMEVVRGETPAAERDESGDER